MLHVDFHIEIRPVHRLAPTDRDLIGQVIKGSSMIRAGINPKENAFTEVMITN